MITKFIENKLDIQNDKILSIILSGGTKYDTTKEHKDIDYFVIVEKDITFRRLFDKENKIDYLCFGLDFINKLINGEDHANKPYVLLDLCNQKEHLKYGIKVVDYDVFLNTEEIKSYFKKWLTKRHNCILKNLSISKNLFYAFVLMYYVKNGEYSLTEEQQENVNSVHKKRPIEEKFLNEFVEFYELDNNFSVELKGLNRYYSKKQL